MSCGRVGVASRHDVADYVERCSKARRGLRDACHIEPVDELDGSATRLDRRSTSEPPHRGWRASIASRPEVEAWRSTFAESTCRSTRNPNLLCILAMFAQKRASARLPTARFRSRPHTRTIRPSELGRGAGRPDRRMSTLKPAGGGAARSIPPTPRVSRAGSPAAIGAIGERSQTLIIRV